jgi:hypothetical protein
MKKAQSDPASRLPKSKHFWFQDAEEEEEIPVRSSENKY